jgi:hypothetical protein
MGSATARVCLARGCNPCCRPARRFEALPVAKLAVQDVTPEVTARPTH